MKKLAISLSAFLFGGILFAQNAEWVEQMDDPSVNFYTVQQNFEEYWEGREVEKGKGWKQFKRWEAFWEPRVYPEGIRPNPSVLAQAYQQLQQNNSSSNLGQWKPLGPYDGPTLNGIGRVNRVRFHPNNNQKVFAATPAGGLWISTDGGQNWTTNTDLLPNLGVSDIAFNPLNPDVIYLATGDRDGGDTYSYGVLKSTDGGNTWNPTGLSFGLQFQVRAHDVYVSPSDTNIVIAVTRSGIYRSTDASANWTRVKTGSYNGLVQKVGNPNVLFSSSMSGSNCNIYRSTDAGITWNQINDPNLPSGNARRIELAVTPDDTNYVYAVIGNSNNGFEGLYRSTDGGDTWTQRANSPNLLGWSTNGSDQGGQAWYDLSIAVNPSDKNEVFVGGVNIWRSSNGGSNWSLAAHWYGGGGAPFVHADVHHLTFQPGTEYLYAGTDGGVYRDMPNQTSWDELNDGMNITQYYRIGASASDTSLLLAGAQDNGTHRLKNSNWARVRGGDGMECAINSKNPNIMYSTVYYGEIRKSVNGGGNFNANFNLPPAGNGNWVTPFVLDPKHPDTIYAGFDRVWRSYNGGVNFNAVSPNGMTGGQNIDQMAIAPINTEIIYVSEGSDLWKTTNRGTNWTNLSSNVPGGSAISYIAIDYDNSDHVVITRSGYNSSQKVYESYDGGQNWNNISSGLPNIPANCVAIENNDEHSLYVGTDVGVFYSDSINPEWVSFNANLPNVIVNELEINYTNRKLRAATYGRGIWESPLFSDLVPPISKADFPSTVCVNDTVNLMDASEYNPEYFKWYIEPVNHNYVSGSSDSTQNPEVVFSQKGIYNISLVAENLLGADSAYFVSAIAVGGLPLPYKSSFDKIEEYRLWSYDPNLNGWEHLNSSKGSSFKASLFNNTDTNARYELISPAIDLSQHDSATLSFDYAYSGLPANSGDSLLVYIAPSCDDTWILIGRYGENGSNNFRTDSASSNVFIPAQGDWCGGQLANCPQIDLTPYTGSEGVRIKFVAVNANGNDIYLDNIEVTGNPTVAPSAAFSSPTQVCAMDSISFIDQTYGSPNSWEWHFSGPENLTSPLRNPKVLFTKAGTYQVKLKVSNSIGADSVTKTSYLTVDPADSVGVQFNFNNDTLCPGSSLNAQVALTNAGSQPQINWFLNGQKVADTEVNDFSYANLSDGDTIYAALNSSLSCAYPDIAYSDTLTVNFYPTITPQINVNNLICSTDSAINLTAVPAGGVFTGKGVSNGSFDPGVAGLGSHEISYEYTDANGCVFTAKKYIGVANPINITINGNLSACINEGEVNLNIGSPLGGLYSGPGVFNNSFYPDSAGLGQHTLTYSYNNPICGTTSESFTVTVHPSPSAPGVLVQQGYLECTISAAGYQWFGPIGAVSGATSKTFTPSVDGNYVVRITDNKGCHAFSDSAGYYIGLKELPKDVEFKLFPNPAQDRIYLDIETDGRRELSLSIFNNVGSLVNTRTIAVDDKLRQAIDISNFASGVYLFSLEGQDLTIRQKIVVQ